MNREEEVTREKNNGSQRTEQRGEQIVEWRRKEKQRGVIRHRVREGEIPSAFSLVQPCSCGATSISCSLNISSRSPTAIETGSWVLPSACALGIAAPGRFSILESPIWSGRSSDHQYSAMVALMGGDALAAVEMRRRKKGGWME